MARNSTVRLRECIAARDFDGARAWLEDFSGSAHFNKAQEIAEAERASIALNTDAEWQAYNDALLAWRRGRALPSQDALVKRFWEQREQVRS